MVSLEATEIMLHLPSNMVPNLSGHLAGETMKIMTILVDRKIPPCLRKKRVTVASSPRAIRLVFLFILHNPFPLLTWFSNTLSKVCDDRHSELIPCLDRNLITQMRLKLDLSLMEHYERHCPLTERRFNCLIPPPHGYKVTFLLLFSPRFSFSFDIYFFLKSRFQLNGQKVVIKSGRLISPTLTLPVKSLTRIGWWSKETKLSSQEEAPISTMVLISTSHCWPT